jgi:hypothetical protein
LAQPVPFRQLAQTQGLAQQQVQPLVQFFAY